MNWNLDTSIFDHTIVAFDTETSGAYPIDSEIIELGAVKWKNGQIIERFQTLLHPSRQLTDDNIRIHGITNEMVATAPEMKIKISEFCEFIDGSILLAHHAPFDLGFLALDIEKFGMSFPQNIHFCTSLLSRALITATNHKLQTLIKELHLSAGAAHRAFDDATACLEVFMKCCEKIDTPVTLQKLIKIQKKEIIWSKYQVWTSGQNKLIQLAKACQTQKIMQIVYEGGQTKNQSRPIRPIGVVRNPDGDYLYAECGLDKSLKRFYLDKIKDYDLT